ncbi:hypothetical protein PP178_03475 [Zeaxanthinibacter sp. PT1]|uniref:hypothetical protein n=1 Tax=Zeaxanthinibacter TaxID=561554 RepID=UPI00234AC52B|nr:hypothetical protein [Zeaxanthinibacter sp. PT1]MDC6350600.1 hypothetical protein [Zeaxanthinibacter sp. PT1]
MTDRPFLNFISKKFTLILALGLLFLTTVLFQLNYNKNHIDNFTVDEYFTISTVHPKYTPENTVYRALNGPRLFTYLFYPGALVGMIGHMGGNIYVESWDYPGYNYLVENYQTRSSQLAANMQDPNLRYFHHYLKMQAVIFMFITFIPLVIYLWRKKYTTAMFMVVTLVGINTLFLEQRSVFYIEPLLLSMINLLLWYYLYIRENPRPSWFIISLGGLLFALTISLKFSCLFILLLITIQMVLQFKGLEKRLKSLITLLLTSLLFFGLINWDLFAGKEVFGKIIHDYFSNFWQYATGNKGVIVENYKLYNLRGVYRELIPSLGGLLFLFPAICFFGLKWADKKERFTWGALLLVFLLTVWAIVKQRVYIDRNILPFLPFLVMLTGVFIDIIRNHIRQTNWYRENNGGKWVIGIFFLVLLLPIFLFSNNMFTKIFPSSKENIMEAVRSVKQSDRQRLVLIDVEADKEELGYSKMLQLPSFPETNGFNLTTELNKVYDTLRSDDVILVTEMGNNKQLTTYGLPKTFNRNKQFGKYFVFYNNPEENKQYKAFLELYDNQSSAIHFSGSKLIREDLVLTEVITTPFENEARIYLRFRYKGGQVENLFGCRMFFHAFPLESEKEQLPPERIEHGFDGWDFTFSKENTFQYGNEVFIYQDFNPTLSSYEKMVMGIFRGCGKSEPFQVDNVKL